MPDKERVIKALECCTSDYGCRDCPYSDDGKTSANCALFSARDALLLLREQETTPVLGGPIYGYAFYYMCEKCKNTLLREDVYCSHCGRKVKWK